MFASTSVLFILVGTLALFIWGYWRYDVVACLALAACILVGAVPFSSVYLGFASPAVITVACVMIISQAIHNSGAVDYLVKNMTPVTSSPVLHIAILTILAAFLSAFMNNVGALTLLMPVAIQTALKSKRSPSLVLMPLAFGSALGGLMTAIGTPPNIIVSNYRQHVTGEAFHMFDFTPVGVSVAVVGLIFIILIGWRLIPVRRKVTDQSGDLFQIQDYITEVSVLESSTVIDLPMEELETKIEGDVSIIGFIRDKKKRLLFNPKTAIKPGDILIIEASHVDLEKLIAACRLELVGGFGVSSEDLRSSQIEVLEAVVPPTSRPEGHSSKSMRLRAHYGINLLALSRKGTAFKERLNAATFQGGDVVLLQGKADGLRETVVRLGFLPLVERGVQVGVKRSIILPIAFFCVAILLTAFRLLPVEIAFSAAVVALVATNTVPARRLYDSIDWSIIVLLAAMIPVGGALQATGGTELIANALMSVAGSFPPIVILGLLMAATMTLSDFMNNAATAVVMAPISVAIAHKMGANIDPFLMAVAIGASCSFLTPIGHQNNILVMGPGGYHFGDYFRMGIWLEILMLLTALPLLLWVWPL